MSLRHRLFQRQRLILLLGLLLGLGFLGTSLLSYFASRDAIRASIVDLELPLTSDNIYTEIQKDLVRPIFVSSMMASDTFLRDWVLHGEKDPAQMTRYLSEVQRRYGAFTSFFVSERSGNYYQSRGVLKRVSRDDPHDVWYYQVRDLSAPYRIDVDTDQANANRLTIFINYKVFDYGQRFLGVAGVGLTVDAVHNYIAAYQQRYRRSIYFVDHAGNIVQLGGREGRNSGRIDGIEGLRELAPRILAERAGSYRYRGEGHDHLLNVRFIPELNWYLFVEQQEDEALAKVRRTLYINLGLCLAVTIAVLLILHFVLDRYHRRLEDMAVTDRLTGLYNRQAFDLLLGQVLAEDRRTPRPLSALLIDVDHFKAVNDRHGHLLGDRVLQALSPLMRKGLRQSDLAFRWGGEEFLILLRGSAADAAAAVAEKLREGIAAHLFDFSAEGVPAPLALTVSIGVAEYHGGEEVLHWLARIDGALYTAKRGGRNRVVLAPVA